MCTGSALEGVLSSKKIKKGMRGCCRLSKPYAIIVKLQNPQLFLDKTIKPPRVIPYTTIVEA